MKYILVLLLLPLLGYAQFQQKRERPISRYTYVSEQPKEFIVYTKDVNVFNALLDRFGCLSGECISLDRKSGKSKIYRLKFKPSNGYKVESFIKRNF